MVTLVHPNYSTLPELLLLLLFPISSSFCTCSPSTSSVLIQILLIEILGKEDEKETKITLIRPKHSTLPTLALLTRLLCRRRRRRRRLFRLLRHVFVVFIVVLLFVIFFLLRALLLFSQRCRVASRTLRSRFLEVPIV